MRRKNWIMPGILMLSVLLLLSFPVIAMADEQTETEPTVVNEVSAVDEITAADDKIVEEAPATSDVAAEQQTTNGDETVLPETTSPQEPEVVENVNDQEPAVGNNDVIDTPSSSETGKAPEEPAVEEPVVEEPTLEQPTSEQPTLEEPTLEQPTSEAPIIETPVVEEPGDTVIDKDDPQPIPIQPDADDSSNQGDEPVTTTPPICGLPSTMEPISDGSQSNEPILTVPDNDQATDGLGVDWTNPVTLDNTGTGNDNNSNSDDKTNNTNNTNSTNNTNETSTTPKAPFVEYLVRKGESLWLIGRNFGVDFLEIMKANNLKDYLIYPDQELIIPGVTTQDGKVVYRIKLGDTFYLLGKALGIDFNEIMKLNGFNDIWIYPGETLLIPEKTDAVALSSSVKEAKAVIAAVGSDLELLARAIYAEARGESFEGQVAVGAVILNRLETVGFPKTIRDIIYQSGAFTAVDDGQINLVPDNEAFRAAQEALDGADPSLGALYYWNPDIATSSWIWSRPIIKQIGDHVFAR